MKIGFLISGQWRRNDTCISGQQFRIPIMNDNIINLIDKLEKDGHSVDVFISTDDLHLGNTRERYGTRDVKKTYPIVNKILDKDIINDYDKKILKEQSASMQLCLEKPELNFNLHRIKNIYLEKSGHINFPIMDDAEFKKVTSIDNYISTYLSQADKTTNGILKEMYGLPSYSVTGYNKCLNQYLKLYIAYLMAKKYAADNNFEYDLLFRLRPDCKMTFNYTEKMLCDIYEEKCILASSDLFACGNYRLMSLYCNLVNSYGLNSGYFKLLNDTTAFRWSFSPEVQLFGIRDEKTGKSLYEYFTCGDGKENTWDSRINANDILDVLIVR